MRPFKSVVIALFFLLSFTSCIGLNCVRNISILRYYSGKAKIESLSSSSFVKSNDVLTAYLIMDKKENETQKYLCTHFLPPASIFRPIYTKASRFKSTVKPDYTESIYRVIHNYRI